MVDTVEIKDRYNTYAELGADVKMNNPNVTLDDEIVGKKYASRHKILVSTPGTGEIHPLNAVVNGLRDMLDAEKGPLRALAAPFQAAESVAGVVSEFGKDAGAGVASGLSLGGTDRLRQFLGTGTTDGVPIPSPEQRSPLAFGGGQMIGEVMGPYRVAHKVLGIPAVGKFASKLPGAGKVGPRLGMALGMGTEAAAVEGTKSAIRGGDVSDVLVDSAIGLALGSVAPLAVQGGAAVWKKGVERWLHPKAGEVDALLLAFMNKWDLPLLVAQLRPSSPLVQGVQRRLSATATTAREMIQMRGKLVDSMERMQAKIVGKLAPNAALKTPREVGLAITDEILAARNKLRLESKTAYDALRKSSVGKTMIRPNLDVQFERIGDEGEVLFEVGSMFKGLKELVGQTGPLSSGPRKKIRNFYVEMKKAHTEPPSPVPKRRPQWEFLVPPSQVPLGITATTKKQNVPLKNYDWWWEQLQQIGAMMDSPKIQKNAADMRLVKKAYHLVQDVIDAHAKAVSPEFSTAIDQARKLHIEFLTYSNNPRVQNILKLTKETPGVTDYPSVVGRLFATTDAVLDAKALLGPEAFNQARQAWIRDLFWDSTKKLVGGERYLSGLKMQEAFDKSVSGGMDGEFIKALFSDVGFTSPSGKIVTVNTHAFEKLKMIREVYEQIPKLEPAIFQLQSKGEAMQQQMAEKVSAAQLINTPTSAITVIKDILVNLITFRKASQIVFEQDIQKNPLMGAPISTIGQGPMPMPGGGALPQEDMYRGVSSILNKMFNGSQ